MASRPLDSPRCARALEDTLAALDAHLADAEKQAAALLKTVRRLRRAAKEGAMASLPAAVAAAQADADRTSEPLAAAAAALDYDVATAFASGAWLDELAAAARAAGVVLVRRDGRVTAYPVALRLDGRAQGLRIGRKLEKRIRPSFVATQLRALQQRPDRFNAVSSWTVCFCSTTARRVPRILHGVPPSPAKAHWFRWRICMIC
jgi:hypothetical protein